MASKKENLNCPLCNEKGYSLLDLPLHLYCPDCNLAWLKKYPKPTYGDDYYKSQSSLVTYLMTPITYIFYVIRNIYTGLQKRELWIDVGAGDGAFLKVARAKEKIGVDVSSSARNLIREKGIKAVTVKQFFKMNKVNADVISFWHVLEHVSNPGEYLEVAKNNLSEEGKIVIGVPNIDCLEYRIFGKHWFHSPKFHFWENSPKSMEILLKKANLRKEFIDYWSPEHHLPCLLQSFVNYSTGTQGALHRFVKRRHEKSFSKKEAFWSVFWLTLGAPLVIFVWVLGSLTKKSGTFVLVASKK